MSIELLFIIAAVLTYALSVYLRYRLDKKELKDLISQQHDRECFKCNQHHIKGIKDALKNKE